MFKIFKILKRLAALETKVKELQKQMAVTQEQIDAITATLGSIDTTVGTIQNEVKALQAAIPNQDLSGLTAAASKLSSDVQSLQDTLAPPVA